MAVQNADWTLNCYARSARLMSLPNALNAIRKPENWFRYSLPLLRVPMDRPQR